MSKEENPKVSCINEFCKYWDGGSGCVREEITITGNGDFPTCDSYEPEEDESDG